MTDLEIETFLTICWHKSISKAAESLHITQSSLSTRLKKLEENIGCQLFFRRNGTRTLELTSEGVQFYQYACQYRDITHNMLSIRQKKEPEELRITVVNSVGTYLFPPVYEQFLRQYPMYRLEIEEADNAPAFANKKLTDNLMDIMFHSDVQIESSLSIFPVFSEPMVIICSVNSSYTDPVSQNQLLPNREISAKWSDSMQEWHQKTFGQAEQPLAKLTTMSNFQMFTSLENCWAIVPLSAAEEIADNTHIRRCQTRFKIPKRLMYCVVRQSAYKRQSVQNFLACLHQELEKKSTDQLDLLF